MDSAGAEATNGVCSIDQYTMQGETRARLRRQEFWVFTLLPAVSFFLQLEMITVNGRLNVISYSKLVEPSRI